MKGKELFYPVLLILLLSMWSNLTLGGKSSKPNPFKPAGSYKIRGISADLEKSTEYKKPSAEDPVDAFYEFMELNESIFQIANPRCDFIPIDTAYEHTRPIITFQQLYHGIAIHGSRIITKHMYSGRLRSVEGEYYYDINLPAAPVTDSSTIVKLALDRFYKVAYPPHPKVIGPKRPQIVLAKDFMPVKDDRLYMVWHVDIFPDTVMRYGFFIRYFIDASSDTFLYRQEGTTLIH